jgi:hypothetical protein
VLIPGSYKAFLAAPFKTCPRLFNRPDAESARSPDRPCASARNAVFQRLQPDSRRRRVDGTDLQLGSDRFCSPIAGAERHSLRKANGESPSLLVQLRVEMSTVEVVKRPVNTTTRGSRGRGHGRRIRGLFVRPDVRTTEASHVADPA